MHVLCAQIIFRSCKGKNIADCNLNLDYIYNETNGEFEILNTHVKKPDIQVQQTNDVMHKQELNPRQIVDPIMAKGNEHHGFGELSGVDELEDEEQSENLDLNREITMKDFLEIGDDEQIENLGQDSKLKLDVDQHPTGKDLDTSPKASINRYPPSIDRHSWLNELPKKADGFHKRVKKIHDLVKLMIPCTLSEDEFPTLPDRSVHLGSFIEVFYDHLHAIAPKTCLRYKYDVDRGPSVAVSNNTTSVSQHPWRIRAQGV
ncbi:hypothetical protein F2Q68_00044148 [Brassica cretica]|uniref:Uncharacterized protein n=1 Tax=Brassica cretica TaxID=69181 RepID=A0A8S9LKS1_BRACR|nr:hypothetical protein F2Q68_00044148 [Brassica cretica]